MPDIKRWCGLGEEERWRAPMSASFEICLGRSAAIMVASAASESLGEHTLDMNGLMYVLIVAVVAWWPFLLLSKGERRRLSSMHSYRTLLLYPESYRRGSIKCKGCTSNISSLVTFSAMSMR